MRNFELVLSPLRLHSGNGSLLRLPDELRRLKCQRAVVFCGGSVSRHPAVLPEIRAILGDSLAGVFDRVQAHSPTDSVVAGAQAIRACNADAVIAIGGGSAVVTARASSIVFAEGLAPRELCTTRTSEGKLSSPKLLAPKIPQLVVPTTPTTAIPKAGSAVHDPETGDRLAMFDPKTRASCVFLEPALLDTSPVGLFKSASLNALAMAVSGLESARSSPMADALLRHALLLLAKWLSQLGAGNDEAEARLQLVHAAILCGQGTDLTGGGLVTALGHSIGAHAGVDNGIVNATLLPHTMRFNAPVIGKQHEPIMATLREAVPTVEGANAPETARALLQSMGTPASLRSLGVRQDAFEAIASHAMLDWSLANNPRPVMHDDILQVLAEAW